MLGDGDDAFTKGAIALKIRPSLVATIAEDRLAVEVDDVDERRLLVEVDAAVGEA